MNKSTKKEAAKLGAVIAKFFAKEFLWVVLVLVIALPLSALFVYLIQAINGTGGLKSELNNIASDVPFIVISYIYASAGIYFTRIVVSSISVIAKKNGND